MNSAFLSISVAVFLFGCSKPNHSSYDEALGCLGSAANFGALSAGGKAAGVEGSDETAKLAADMIARWKSKVLVAGGALGKSESEIARDVRSSLGRSSNAMSAGLDRDYKKTVDSVGRANTSCIERL